MRSLLKIVMRLEEPLVWISHQPKQFSLSDTSSHLMDGLVLLDTFYQGQIRAEDFTPGKNLPTSSR
jgi:hypothetical protein